MPTCRSQAADADRLIPRITNEIAPRTPSCAASREADRTVSEPLTAELCRLHVTIPTKSLAKIEAARAMLSHNQDAARRVFGDAYVDACIQRRRAGGGTGQRVAARAEDGP